MSKFKEQLAPFLPQNTAEFVSHYIVEKKVKLRISKPRLTKLGDYRSPHGGNTHQISVNGNLNRYAFFITLIHEFAHLETWISYKNKVKPHGKEWKKNFQTLMLPFLSDDTFPRPIKEALNQYMSNPAASSCSDQNLSRVLRKFDEPKNEQLLETIPTGTIFEFRSRKFIKKEKQRTRFKCEDQKNGKVYLINGLAEVLPVKN